MLRYLRNVFDFRGLTNRKDFWITIFVLAAIYLLLLPLVAVIALMLTSINVGAISAIVLLFSILIGSIVPVLLLIAVAALFVRRLRDSKIPTIGFILSVVASPFVSLSLLMILPREVIETIKIYGRSNPILASSALIFFIFGLPFISVGFFPSKKPN